MKKPADIRDAVLAGLDARRQGAANIGGVTPGVAAGMSRQPAYVATFGRQLNDGLKDKIAQLEQERSGGTVVLKLDPRRIAPSAFANRDHRSLTASDPDLVALIGNIRSQGQLEPIRLRPAEPGGQFEY